MGEEGHAVQEQGAGQIASAPVASTFPKAPVHWGSAVVTIAIDGLWSIPEMIAAASVVGLLLVPILSVVSGLCCLVAVLLIQKFVAKDGWGAATVKSVVVGIVAAIPFPFIGSILGVILLGWWGLQALAQTS